MYAEDASQRSELTSQERRRQGQRDDRLLGRVSRCDGATAVISGYAPNEAYTALTVGKLITINLGPIRTVALVYSIERIPGQTEDILGPTAISVELIGEVRDIDGKATFDRGITEYPFIGAPAHRIRSVDLQAIYDLGGASTIRVGTLSQDSAVDAVVAVDTVLSRHFAIVGTTGVGKSTAVTLLLRKIVEAKPDLSVVLFDPHNEFSSALPDLCMRMDLGTLVLPFWLFRMEELTEVLYRGREAPADELELLRDLIVHAKHGYREPTISLRRKGDATGITADTPIPYRIADVIAEISNRMGALDAKVERPHLRQLRLRLEAALNDPLYRFMFGTHVSEDSVHETLGAIFRLPNDGRPITCMEMAGVPGEVVNAVCSVLARLAFDLTTWGNGKLKILIMCEEAHRYIPSDPRLGFAPTRHALARIAREGRKYGCYLGVITQRPGDLDPTVLSQCSTIFAMRLANEADQAIIKSATGDASASTLAFLPALGQREAIAFGEGVATTMRLKFERVPEMYLPGKASEDPLADSQKDGVDLRKIMDKMRNITPPAVAQAAAASQRIAASEPASTPSTPTGSRFFS
ncbi:ATPase [Nitratireductor aestuarii]|uniref:ATPase n=1 Tax=Nitratireductor aestuarii TaxID=1735103 RepID=A0A916S381_9HYPH|nr:DUF87 domain-containing protein [Nitratireductor aestuarii]GGA80637.1 ATPase [Nitratireductor aestuarii]